MSDEHNALFMTQAQWDALPNYQLSLPTRPSPGFMFTRVVGGVRHVGRCYQMPILLPALPGDEHYSNPAAIGVAWRPVVLVFGSEDVLP